MVDDEHVVTDPVTICDLNLETCSLEDTQFVAQFVMQAKRDAEITAMAGYFDTFFELENEVSECTVLSVTLGRWSSSRSHSPLVLAARPLTGSRLSSTSKMWSRWPRGRRSVVTSRSPDLPAIPGGSLSRYAWMEKHPKSLSLNDVIVM